MQVENEENGLLLILIHLKHFINQTKLNATEHRSPVWTDRAYCCTACRSEPEFLIWHKEITALNKLGSSPELLSWDVQYQSRNVLYGSHWIQRNGITRKIPDSQGLWQDRRQCTKTYKNVKWTTYWYSKFHTSSAKKKLGGDLVGKKIL